MPEDSNNSDHCKQYSEFDTCKLCNSGYTLMPDGTCQLTDEDIDTDPIDDPIEDNETPSEDLFWHTCTSHTGVNGYTCPSDTFAACLTLHDGSEVECSTWIDMIAEHNHATNCSLCPAAPIPFCATQNFDKCTACIDGYFADETQTVCLKDCGAGLESTSSGECVSPVDNCTPGSTLMLDNGDIICSLCKPGFEITTTHECLALPDPENCAEVEMTNPERTCKLCNEG